jgi:hypothetical protein
MQPTKPLPPGTTFIDPDLPGDEPTELYVLAAESKYGTGCGMDIGGRRALNCAYVKGCHGTRSCEHSPRDRNGRPNVVYLRKLEYATFKLTQLVV